MSRVGAEVENNSLVSRGCLVIQAPDSASRIFAGDRLSLRIRCRLEPGSGADSVACRLIKDIGARGADYAARARLARDVDIDLEEDRALLALFHCFDRVIVSAEPGSDIDRLWRGHCGRDGQEQCSQHAILLSMPRSSCCF